MRASACPVRRVSTSRPGLACTHTHRTAGVHRRIAVLVCVRVFGVRLLRWARFTTTRSRWRYHMRARPLCLEPCALSPLINSFLPHRPRHDVRAHENRHNNFTAVRFTLSRTRCARDSGVVAV